MTARQLEFFQRLCAPFETRALFSKSVRGTNLTYLKAPTIMNRLDDVAGPDGWDVKYAETDRGYTCTIGICVPTDDGESVWIYKSDGGGYEGMTKNSGGQSIEDTDNDEKSAYTNAFRRAAYSWGIGRYLWKAGVPSYLGAEPEVPHVEPEVVHAPAAPRETSATPSQRQAPAQSRPAPARPAPARPGNGNGNGNGNKQYDNFQIPRSGRALYAWACQIGDHYKCGKDVVKLMDGFAKDRGYQGKYVDYDEVMTADVAWEAIEEIRSWQSYGGEFDHVAMPECLGNP